MAPNIEMQNPAAKPVAANQLEVLLTESDEERTADISRSLQDADISSIPMLRTPVSPIQTISTCLDAGAGCDERKASM